MSAGPVELDHGRAVLRAVVIHRAAVIYRARRLRGRIPKSLALRYPLESTR